MQGHAYQHAIIIHDIICNCNSADHLCVLSCQHAENHDSNNYGAVVLETVAKTLSTCKISRDTNQIYTARSLHFQH